MADTIIFQHDGVIMSGVKYTAGYSITPNGKVCVFVTIDGEVVKTDYVQGDDFYPDALHAAQEANQRAQDEKAAFEAERKAKAQERAERKAQREASTEPRIHTPTPDKPWIGTTIKGKGWEIALGDGYDRIRVIFKKPPCAGIKELVKEFGFYYSPTLKSWNRGVTCKGYRAAEKLASHLRCYPDKPLFA